MLENPPNYFAPANIVPFTVPETLDTPILFVGYSYFFIRYFVT